MSEPAIRFASVTKNYGQAKVLRGISFEIPRGACFGLVGINGAGKTTLLKCLLDFCTFESGTIELSGMAHNAPGARARLAFLPERLNPPYYLTGADFLCYTLEMQAMQYEPGAAARMLEALEVRFPWSAGALVGEIRQNARVVQESCDEDGYVMSLLAEPVVATRLRTQLAALGGQAT